MNAVLLAGGRAEDPLARAFGAPSKGFVPLAGRPMAAWVAEALRAGGVKRLVLVAPEAAPSLSEDARISDRGSLLENVAAGLRAAGAGPVLVAAADAPLIPAEAVRFVARAEPGAAFVYPIVPRAAVEARWPGMRRTYARLKEGSFTGGNLMRLDPELFFEAEPLIARLIALRKRPLALARLVGLDVLVKLLIGRLSVAELEARAERIIQVPVKAVVAAYPEIGVDADKPEDLPFFERELEAKVAHG